MQRLFVSVMIFLRGIGMVMYMTMLMCVVLAEPPHNRSIQVELGKVEGFESTLQLLKQALVIYLNVEQQLIGCWYKKNSCAKW